MDFNSYRRANSPTTAHNPMMETTFLPPSPFSIPPSQMRTTTPRMVTPTPQAQPPARAPVAPVRGNRMQMLEALMAADFFVLDMGLYLDTHPNDTQALKMFSDASETASRLRMEFEAAFGPLTIPTAGGTTRWNWIDDPWPWDNGNRR